MKRTLDTQDDTQDFDGGPHFAPVEITVQVTIDRDAFPWDHDAQAAALKVLDDAVDYLNQQTGLAHSVRALEAAELTRFYRSTGDTPSSHTLTVPDLMDENGDFEDSAWTYMQDVVQYGHYDDSDWSSGILCYYTATDGPQPIIDAAAAWYDANPEIVAEQELTDPRTWKVGR